MAIAVARIQAAINRLHVDRVRVTIERVAKKIGKPRKKVEPYFRGMPHLKEQLMPERSTHLSVGRYELAILRMRKKNLLITYRRIARHAHSKSKFVKTWCMRRNDKLHDVTIVGEVEFRDHCIERRILWLKKTRACATKELTKTDIAHALGIDRGSLNRILRRIERRKSCVSTAVLVDASRGEDS